MLGSSCARDFFVRCPQPGNTYEVGGFGGEEDDPWLHNTAPLHLTVRDTSFVCVQVGDVHRGASVPRHQLPDLRGGHVRGQRRRGHGPHRLPDHS